METLIKTYNSSSAVTPDFVTSSHHIVVRFMAGADTDTGFEIQVVFKGSPNFKGRLQIIKIHHFNLNQK